MSAFGVLLVLGVCAPLAAQDAAPPTGPRILEFHFTPVHNAQLALWIEDESGTFKATVALTEAVALRGIGNRPGASQMNSGFRWPYGRREGVLPIWAHRRMTAPGARPFKRVIFQDRLSEGRASRTSDDASRDDYFCLSFQTAKSKRDALDAVSCASVFNSDKGRYITDADVAAGYAEPYEDVLTHEGRMQALSLDSLYPPRRDFKACPPGAYCDDHPDASDYDAHAHEIMPDIDSVTMATPPGGEPQQRLFSVPDDWPAGAYRACIEANVEGDYNAFYDNLHYPTPLTPDPAWDQWATGFGYPYRGQPSVVYCVPFNLQIVREADYHTQTAEGSSASWDTAAPGYGTLGGMDTLTDDPDQAPGSGGDRLMRDQNGDRFVVIVKAPELCGNDTPPSAVSGLALAPYPDRLEAHQWAELDFRAARDDRAVFRYDVRVSTDPIVDEASFMRGQPAKSATTAAEALDVPNDVAAGDAIKVDIGGLIGETHYYVAVRAVDACAEAGPISVAEITTPKREFATVSPCFVATAAYGTPLASEIGALRRLRDRQLATNAPGRAFVALYNQHGPKLAAVIRGDDTLRAATRALLAPLVALARRL
jgi:hypothetical protein